MNSCSVPANTCCSLSKRLATGLAGKVYAVILTALIMLSAATSARAELNPGAGLVKAPSASAQEIARLAGIAPILEQLSTEQKFLSHSGPELTMVLIAHRQKFIYLRNKLNALVQAMNLEINATRGEIDAAIAQADELRAYITEQRNRVTHRNSQINLVSGGITKMIGYGLALSSVTAIPTNTLEVFDGSVQSTLSALALKEQRHENKLEHGMPPMLSSFLGDSPPSPNYPAIIWAYLNHSPNGSESPQSRRNLLISSWQNKSILEPAPQRSGRHQKVSVELLDQRLAMLSDLKSLVSEMHHGLMELSDSIVASYSEDPEF